MQAAVEKHDRCAACELGMLLPCRAACRLTLQCTIKQQIAPWESHFLGVKQVVQTLLYNFQLHIAFLQLFQQVGDL